MKVYLVEKIILDSDCESIAVFDSIWKTKARAEEYAKEEFNQRNWASHTPDYEITEVEINQ
jgi:hypothetical protein